MLSRRMCASQARTRRNHRFDHKPTLVHKCRAARARRWANCLKVSMQDGCKRNSVATIFLWSESISEAMVAWGGHREHLQSKTGTTARSKSFKRCSMESLLARADPALAQKALHICRLVFLKIFLYTSIVLDTCPKSVEEIGSGPFFLVSDSKITTMHFNVRSGSRFHGELPIG